MRSRHRTDLIVKDLTRSWGVETVGRWTITDNTSTDNKGLPGIHLTYRNGGMTGSPSRHYACDENKDIEERASYLLFGISIGLDVFHTA